MTGIATSAHRCKGHPQDAPHPIGSLNSHDTLRKVLASANPQRVLDVPCGRGPMSVFLEALGWDVHCADIDRGLFEANHLPFTAVDLNRPLPFDDGAFDAVVCANGLHRLFNPRGALEEVHRILRNHGTLYLNLNNYASIDRRLWFLLFGGMDRGLNEMHCIQTIDNPEAHVRQCLTFPTVANLVTHAGFAINNVWAADVRWRQRVLAPLAWCVSAARWCIPRERREREWLNWTASPAICPGGTYMLLECRKHQAA